MHTHSQLRLLISILLSITFSFKATEAFSQQQCMDLGTGIGISNNENALIDFFKNGGRWEPVGENNHPWYKVWSLDTFKIVNGAYWHWDADWSGTVNNEAWGEDWADCYISYWDMMVDQGKIRTDGYPTEFPLTVYKYLPKSVDPDQAIDNTQDVEIQSLSRRIYFPENLPRSGWILKWEGTGRFEFQGLENVVTYSGTSTQLGNSWTPDGSFAGYNYAFESTGGGRIETDLNWMIHGWVLNLIESDPSDPIRNIVFLYPGLEAAYDAGEIFNPLFVERMQQFSSLRYMGYNNGNDIECRTRVSESHPYRNSHMLERMRWDEHTPENWYRINNGSGGNYEYIINLSNETNTDPWVNIPYCAGEAYVEELVNLFMEGLNPDLTLYLEVGNEMWNYAPGFAGYHWQAAVRVRDYPGLGDVEARGAFINSLLGKVTEVAGERNLERIVRVFAGFPRYYDINNRTINYIDSENWDAFATTWYFNLSYDNSDNNECRDPASGNNWRTVLYNWHLDNPTDQDGFNQRYRDYLLTEFRCNGSYKDNPDALLANYYNKELICYEGGNHTLYGCTNSPTRTELPGELEFDAPVYPNYITNNDFINSIALADESDEMGEVYNEILDSMQAAGMRLANHLSFAGRSSCYGVWDLIQTRDMGQSLEYLLSNYPKFRVFSERVASSNCDEVEIILDTNTVGPGLSILLDGIDDYVEGANTYIPDESSDYALEAWFNPLFIDVNQHILSLSNNGTDNNFNVVKLRDDGRLVWEIGNNVTITANLVGPVIETNKWQHVALTKNGQRYTLYLNGFVVASNNFTMPSTIRTNFTIGASENSSVASNWFAGYIDEVRLWDVARSASDIREYMCKKLTPSAPNYGNLRTYYRFDTPNYTTLQAYNQISGSLPGQLQNITITDRSRYAISGAALGDLSRYRYASNWNGLSLSITHPDGDMLAVSNIGEGSPDGVHLYLIEGESHYNTPPEYYDGISNKRVYGVFMANGSNPNYDLNLVYNGNPDALSGAAEADHRLLRRQMYSSEEWLHAGAELNILANSFSLACKEQYRGEYNLAFRHEQNTLRPGSGMALQNNQAPTQENHGLLRYLNLEDYTVTFWAKGWGAAYNFTEKNGAGAHRFTLSASSNNRTGCGLRHDGLNWASQNVNSDAPVAMQDEWAHYAVTRSGSRLTIYVNGMIVGQGDLTDAFPIREMHLFHDPSWQDGNYPGGVCNLTMDELSVWNVALDQNTIREWMCKKLNDAHPNECENLVVYFNFDQGAGTILEDKRGPSDISLISVAEGFNYVTSGAAIGDVSINNYSSPENLSFSHPNGDYLEVNRTSGSSNGIHIYRTDNFPPVSSNTDNASIVSMDSTRYWGIFAVKPYDVSTTYSVTNFYENNTQVNLANESELRLLSRFDNASNPWLANIDILPNTTDHSISIDNQSRGEYVLGGTSALTFEDYTAPDQPVFLPETNDLNSDTICGNSPALVYAVEHDPLVTTYIWTIPEGLDGYSVSDTIILNASYAGAEIDSFTISVVAVNAYGESDSAHYGIIVLPAPTVADAGPDQLLIPPANSTLMDGNIPQPSETGSWLLSTGSGTIDEVNNPATAINSIGIGNNTFIWSISNSACPASTDSVLILFAPPPQNVVLSNGDPLPRIVCEGEIITVRAIPTEDVPNNGYQWTLPEGLVIVSQDADTAVLQINNGIGGSIAVAALYGVSPSTPSENYLTQTININPQPNTPVFAENPDVLCLNVDERISINFDATIDSVEWILPEGIYPVDYPKSSNEAIDIQAIDIMTGYISAKTFNNGCTSTIAIDSFLVNVNAAPDKPELFLGTDGGTADQFCGDEYALLWVENADENVNYEWTWDVYTNLEEYLDSAHTAALFQMPERNNEIRVRAMEGEGACSTSEWFVFNGWTQDVSPSVINSITITDPLGQDPLALQIGQEYTLEIDGTGDHYYWDIPVGFELIDDGDLFDEINRVRVITEGAGNLDVYSITLRGCSSHSHQLGISTSGAIMPPEYLSGALTICQGTNLNITVSDVSATEYTWTLPNGTVYNTSVPVLDVPISTAMKGSLLVTASNVSYTTPPTIIAIEVQAINLSALGFVDEDGNTIEEIEVCNGDRGRPIYHKDALASSYIWEIHGTSIEFNPRWEPGYEGDSDYELRNRTSPVDTMMSINWVSWRTRNDGNDGGFIVVRAINGCGGAHVSDSVYYYWQEPLDVVVPEFVEAPTELCVGSSVNYELRNIDGADEYIWNLPNGLVASNIVTSVPSITADVVNGVGGSLSVYARGESCGGSTTIPQVVEPINISGEAIDFYFINAPTGGCPGDSLMFSVNDIGAGVYNWTAPEGLRTTMLDDSEISGVTITGSWQNESRDNMINQQYRRASNESVNSILYTPDLPYTGTYEVSISGFLRYDNVSDMPVTINHRNGTDIQYVNITLEPENGIWRSIGEFEFEAGTSGSVEIATHTNGGGVSIADAVRFEIVSIPNGTSHKFPNTGEQGGAVCVSVDVPQCESAYTICSEPVDLGGSLNAPMFTVQENSVCEGMQYVYSVNDIGADSYTWHLPEGASISGSTGIVSGQERSVTITMDTDQAIPIQIGVNGYLNFCSISSDTIYTSNILFDGIGCSVCDTFSVSITGLEIINPTTCAGTGSAIIHLQRAPNSQVYDIDFNFDGVIDASGIVNHDSIVIPNLPQGTQISALVITEVVNQCEVFSADTGSVATYAPALITLSGEIQAARCNATGGFELNLSGAYTGGDIYGIDFNSDGVYDDSTAVTAGGILAIYDLAIGTIVNGIQIINTTNQCVSNTDYSDTIEAPISFSIMDILVNNPPSCDGYGSIEILLDNGINFDTFEIDLGNNGSIDYITSLQNDWLLVPNLEIGTAINEIQVIHRDTRCSAIRNEDIVIEQPETMEVSLSPISESCENHGAIQLNHGEPVGGIYTINNDTVTAIEPEHLGAGTYTIVYSLTDENNCQASTSGQFIINPIPEAIIEGDQNLCPEQQGVLYSTKLDPNYRYLWTISGGTMERLSDNSEVLVDWSIVDWGRLALVVFNDETGCSNRFAIELNLSDTIAPEIENCIESASLEAIFDEAWLHTTTDDDLELKPTAYDYCAGDDIAWHFLVSNADTFAISEFVGQRVEMLDNQSITWLASDGSGNTSSCITSIEFTIKDKPPTAFSPNDDGVNDTWQIDFLLTHPDCIVKVFNRWGNMIYESEKGYPIPWDGKQNGRTLPVDTYYYIIDLGSDGSAIKGYLNLIY